eukprot:jgi/Botrbrau1/16081/Bobra.7_2s0052.1
MIALKTLLEALSDPLGKKSSRGPSRPSPTSGSCAPRCSLSDPNEGLTVQEDANSTGLKGIFRDAWETYGAGQGFVRTRRYSMSSLDGQRSPQTEGSRSAEALQGSDAATSKSRLPDVPKSWSPPKDDIEESAVEFIPGLGYESVDLNATLVLTGMRMAEDGPLKLSRHTLSNWSLTTFSSLMETYIGGMRKCLVQINDGGRMAISAALKLQGLLNEVTALGTCVAAWQPRLLMRQLDAPHPPPIGSMHMLAGLQLSGDQKRELQMKHSHYLFSDSVPSSPCFKEGNQTSSTLLAAATGSPKVRSIYHQTRCVCQFTNYCLQQILSLEQAALTFITSFPNYPDLLTLVDEIADEETRQRRVAPSPAQLRHKRSVSVGSRPSQRFEPGYFSAVSPMTPPLHPHGIAEKSPLNSEDGFKFFSPVFAIAARRGLSPYTPQEGPPRLRHPSCERPKTAGRNSVGRSPARDSPASATDPGRQPHASVASHDASPSPDQSPSLPTMIGSDLERTPSSHLRCRTRRRSAEYAVAAHSQCPGSAPGARGLQGPPLDPRRKVGTFERVTRYPTPEAVSPFAWRAGASRYLPVPRRSGPQGPQPAPIDRAAGTTRHLAHLPATSPRKAGLAAPEEVPLQGSGVGRAPAGERVPRDMAPEEAPCGDHSDVGVPPLNHPLPGRVSLARDVAAAQGQAAIRRLRGSPVSPAQGPASPLGGPTQNPQPAETAGRPSHPRGMETAGPPARLPNSGLWPWGVQPAETQFLCGTLSGQLPEALHQYSSRGPHMVHVAPPRMMLSPQALPGTPPGEDRGMQPVSPPQDLRTPDQRTPPSFFAFGAQLLDTRSLSQSTQAQTPSSSGSDPADALPGTRCGSFPSLAQPSAAVPAAGPARPSSSSSARNTALQLPRISGFDTMPEQLESLSHCLASSLPAGCQLVPHPRSFFGAPDQPEQERHGTRALVECRDSNGSFTHAGDARRLQAGYKSTSAKHFEPRFVNQRRGEDAPEKEEDEGGPWQLRQGQPRPIIGYRQSLADNSTAFASWPGAMSVRNVDCVNHGPGMGTYCPAAPYAEAQEAYARH